MAKITGSKTTKAAEAASLKKARTQHRVGIGQLFIQPTAHADREAALIAAAEKVDPDFPSKAQVDDYQAEVAAIDFVKGPAPVEAQEAMRHVRPTARYSPNGSEIGTTGRAAERQAEVPAGCDLVKVGPQQWTVLVGHGFTTEKQAKWMMDIAHRPSITDEMRFSLRVRLQQGFARPAASAFITKYKDTPTAAATEAMVEAVAPGASTEEVTRFHSGTPQVEAGRYAVEEEGVLKFFRVSKGKGRWAGRTFLEIQASDDRHAVRSPGRRNAILATIAENPLEAQVRYGREIGKCYECGRTLTDPVSRDLGIGPDCRSK